MAAAVSGILWLYLCMVGGSGTTSSTFFIVISVDVAQAARATGLLC